MAFLTVIFGFASGIWGLAVLAVAMEGSNSETIIMGCIVEILLLWLFFLCLKKYRSPQNREKREKAQIEYQKWKQEAPQRKYEAQQRRAREAEFRYSDNFPITARVVTSQTKTKTSGGLGSAVVGGLIAGPVGAVVGASVGSKKTTVTGETVTFAVKYESGRTGTETVKVGSQRFNQLAELLVD